MTATINTRAIMSIYETAEKYAAAVTSEMQLEDERIEAKMAAIKRIIDSGDNPLTGKPHSFSSAEAVVNTDKEYSKYLAKQRDAVAERIMAKARYEAALAEARLRGEDA